MTLPVSPRWLEQIKKFEGYRASAYRDPAGVWTIGYGFTKNVTPSSTISRTEADARLIAELQHYAGSVESLCHTVELTEGQRDALIDFAFNLGVGALAKSTLLKCVLAGDNEGAAAQFGKWIFAGGRKLPGLVERRARERERFLSAQAVQPPGQEAEGASQQDAAPALPAAATPRSSPHPTEDTSATVGTHPQPEALPQPAGGLLKQPDEASPEPAEPETRWQSIKRIVGTIMDSRRVKAGVTIATGSQVPSVVDSTWASFVDWLKNDDIAIETLWSYASAFLALKVVGWIIVIAGIAWLIMTLFRAKSK